MTATIRVADVGEFAVAVEMSRPGERVTLTTLPRRLFPARPRYGDRFRIASTGAHNDLVQIEPLTEAQRA